MKPYGGDARPLRPWSSTSVASAGSLARAALTGVLALGLGGCGTLRSVFVDPFVSSGPQLGTPGFVRGFLGGVAAQDPAAALAARNVLSAGGTAVDAAVAAGFVMAATLPSRVGLGGGGACLVHDPAKRGVEAVLFLPGARAAVPPNADRPAAVPLLARGLFALHTRLPGRPIEELIAPAEQLARFGTELSRSLAADLAAVAAPLAADPGARAVFFRPDGQPRTAGEPLTQPALASTLAQLRTSGIGDLHQGALARRVADASLGAGGGLTVEELRAALPTVSAPLLQPGGVAGDQVAFLPPPADGGLAAAAAYAALRGRAEAGAAAARGLGAASAWRSGQGQPAAILASTAVPQASLGILPASAALVVFDRNGAAVSCAFTMNNLFGTGRMATGMGFLLAPAPGIGSVAPPLLSAAIAYNPNIRGFRAAAAGDGQEAAPMAVAGPLALHLVRGLPASEALATGVPSPGRGQFAACLNYLPGPTDRCTVVTDPRGGGVAVGAVDP